MKIRYDFVTNSSSSSYIVRKRAELISKDGEVKAYFDSQKVEGEGSDIDYDAPFFKEFVSEQYLDTGKKPTPASMASSQKAMKEYAAFLSKKKPDRYSFSNPASFIKEESRRESGEFCGGALENFWFDSRDCFHPQLRSLIGEQWSLFGYYQDIRFMHYAPCFVEKKCGNVKYDYVRFYHDDPDTGDRFDDTERFFRMIYKHFGKPELDIDVMSAHLISCALSQKDIVAIKKNGYKVMYCSNKSAKHDKGNSIILIDPKNEDVIAKSLYEYLKAD